MLKYLIKDGEILMGKKIVIILTLLILFNTFTLASETETGNFDKNIYHDVIITSLSQPISKALVNYYKKLYKHTPGLDVYTTEIKKIMRPNGNRTTYFIIEVDVSPYFGPHITVGKDRISIQLKQNEEPKIIKFEHLKDYKLPKHYNDIYLNN